MDILFILIVITAFTFNDIIPVYKKRQWKVFWTYTAIMSLIVIITALIQLNVKIPSPILPINKLVAVIFGVQAE